MYDAKLIDKKAFLKALEKLKETGFRIGDKVVDKLFKKLARGRTRQEPHHSFGKESSNNSSLRPR